MPLAHSSIFDEKKNQIFFLLLLRIVDEKVDEPRLITELLIELLFSI